ncbi:MAG: response regulator [Phycisphaerae bacterium]
MTRVLVAEDDAGIRRVISLWLTRQGYEVHAAQNGREALELFDCVRPTVLITDVNMPEMDGLTLIDALRTQGRDVKGIIVLTNRWDHTEIGQRLERTGVHVSPKPFSPARLAALVASITSGEGTVVETARQEIGE